MSGLLDRLLDFEERHEKLVGALLGAWFMLSCAVYAGFVTIPSMPEWLESWLFWGSAAFNAIWYGFTRPALTRRKATRQLETESR